MSQTVHDSAGSNILVDELRIIEAVKQEVSLWDIRHDSYKNSEAKPARWKAIADKLGKDQYGNDWTAGMFIIYNILPLKSF